MTPAAPRPSDTAPRPPGRGASSRLDTAPASRPGPSSLPAIVAIANIAPATVAAVLDPAPAPASLAAPYGPPRAASEASGPVPTLASLAAVRGRSRGLYGAARKAPLRPEHGPGRSAPSTAPLRPSTAPAPGRSSTAPSGRSTAPSGPAPAVLEFPRVHAACVRVTTASGASPGLVSRGDNGRTPVPATASCPVATTASGATSTYQVPATGPASIAGPALEVPRKVSTQCAPGAGRRSAAPFHQLRTATARPQCATADNQSPSNPTERHGEP